MSNKKETRNKVLVSSLGAALAASALVPTAVAADSSFPDVSEGHQYYEVIHQLKDAGVVNGYEDGEFKMFTSMTRAEASKMIVKILDLDTDDSTGGQFSDVPDSAWYAKYVNTLYDEGYISGMGDGTFDPNKQMTRAEFAQLIVNSYEIENEEADLPFGDLRDGAWYEPAIETLYANGLINGLTPITFGPEQDVKRGDFAWLLANTDYKFGDKLPKPDGGESESYELSLMHTNDTHANLDDVARRVTAVENVRAEKPNALLLDAGDVFSGTLYFNEFLGQADLEFMNLMEYDLMTFGNHEFDLGSSPDGHKALADFVTASKFPYVSSNVDFSQDSNMKDLFNDEMTDSPEDGQIYNSVIEEIDGEKVGVFGLTTAETADISSPEDITFEDYIEAAEEQVASFEKEGIDKIVGLTHIGYDDNPNYDNDLLLAEHVEGIDVIVGGHSHTSLDEPTEVSENKDGEEKDPTVIVQASQYGSDLGTLDVEFDENGVVTGFSGELLEVSEFEENPEAAEMLEEYSSQIEKVENEESGGVAVTELPNPRTGEGSDVSVRNSETKLGNLITDGMLDKAKEYDENVIAAFQNGGGIRTSIDQGPITIGEILEVMPFGNTLATMELTGAEIKQALEHSVSEAPSENGGFLHVSGMEFTYSSSEESGNRVQSVEFKKGEDMVALEDEEEYLIATNAFTAKGGDGFDVFAAAYDEGRVTDLGSSDWENFRDYVAELGEVDPEIEGRIVDEAK
ncbi:5'-nucleotidase C-terminal domain-containing protein [Halobacillus campisalis]|uniref:5'-nucleotidase C-terminal domain-containing protein n=1 Tax=Halobacillus campisalis TaxID=435909 RepID=A0ABW2K6T1_9BACI|nr:5'-nucleotidase C-terminal domain-containing protein [Halobacillus campisalis]